MTGPLGSAGEAIPRIGMAVAVVSHPLARAQAATDFAAMRLR